MPTRARAPALAVALCLALAALPSCGRRSAKGGGEVQVYTVRGQIVQLPDPARPASELHIRHEAIPNFVGKTGQVVGMGSMVMPFPVAPGVSLAGLAVNEKVEFDFEVRWTGSPIYQVTRLAPLPAGTPLEWEQPTPADGAPPGGR